MQINLSNLYKIFFFKILLLGFFVIANVYNDFIFFILRPVSTVKRHYIKETQCSRLTRLELTSLDCPFKLRE